MANQGRMTLEKRTQSPCRQRLCVYGNYLDRCVMRRNFTLGELVAVEASLSARLNDEGLDRLPRQTDHGMHGAPSVLSIAQKLVLDDIISKINRTYCTPTWMRLELSWPE
jgi:hypothetical protein